MAFISSHPTRRCLPLLRVRFPPFVQKPPTFMPPSSLDLVLLGGFACRIHGIPLPSTRTRHATLLLALLALRHDSHTERGVLAAALWPDHNEEIGRSYLRRSLLDLRTALGTEAERILSPTRQTLQLDLSGDVLLDVREFDRAIAAGGRDGLDRTIALYRGPLLPELEAVGTLEDFVHWERERRNRQFLEALEKRGELRRSEGDLEGAITDLHRLLAIDPLNEPWSLRLMELLVEAKNRAGALAEYQRLRERFAGDLGMEPAPETRAFAERIQQSLGTATDGAVPAVAVGAGSLRMSEPVMVSGVPLPLTRFFGREAERNLLRDWISGSPDVRQRLVTVTGPPGIGKTRLSVEAARYAALQRDEVRAVWFVPFADVRSEAAGRGALGRALGVPANKADDPDSIASILRGTGDDERIALLILDNLEHLLGEEGASATKVESDDDIALLVHRLLNAVPSLTCLISSRRPLLLGGEQELRLPALDVSEEAAAVALFVDRARLANATFVPDSSDLVAIAALCRHLEGVPLALEMAAARIRDNRTPSQILEDLNARQPALDSAQRDLPTRQRSLYAAVDWSYGLLSETEKALLARISVFVGGGTAPAAQAVCGFGVVEPEQVPDLLQRLTVHSLLIADSDAEEPRYRMLEFVRQYAEQKRKERGETEEVRLRHADWYLVLANEGGPKVRVGSEQMRWLSLFEREHDNFRAVLLATNENEQDRRLRISAALNGFWYMRSYLTEGREHLRRALSPFYTAAGTSSVAEYLMAKQDTKGAQDVAKAFDGAGLLAFAQGDYAMGLEVWLEAMVLYRWLGETNRVMVLLGNSGGASAQMGDFTTARTSMEKSLALARELGDKRAAAAALNNLGDMTKKQNDYAASRTYLEEGLAYFRELGEKHGIAMATNNLGEVAISEGEYDSAWSYFREALSYRREIGDKRGITFSLRGLAEVRLALSDARTAVVLLGAEDALRREIGLTLSDSYQVNLEQNLAQARAALSPSDASNGGDDFDAAWALGLRLGWEQATRYVLDEGPLE